MLSSASAHMRIFHSAKKIIEELNPSIVVIDSFLRAGFEACYSLNQRFVTNSPNALLDITRSYQPWLKGLWYYPLFVFFSSSNPVQNP